MAADPIQPEAPVTKMLMNALPFMSEAFRPSRAATVLATSTLVMTRCDMTVADDVIMCHHLD